MKRVLAVILFLLTGATMAAAAPTGTAFSYQGRLRGTGGVQTGAFDFQFVLYDAAVGGSQVGPILDGEDVAVTSGLFTVPLDFGPVFDGSARFLEVGVRPGGSTGAFTILTPRQEVTAAPHALTSGATADPTAQKRTVAPACASGQYLRALGPDGTPTCAPDLDTNSGGTVTSVAAGPGLSGGTITLTGTLAVLFSGTGTAATAARSDHDHDTAYQARISGTCPAGFSIQRVNADGSVGCLESGAAPAATITRANPTTGNFPSLVIGRDGLALISHGITFPGGLVVTHCSNSLCTAATTTVLDTASQVWYSSITIGTDGLGLISYSDNNPEDLKVAHCHDVACTAATISTLDTFGDVGISNAITIGADGLGLIAYLDNTNGRLKAAHCTDVACTTAALTIVDAVGFTGGAPSITIGTDGFALIAYADFNNVHLHVAHCNNAACTGATLTTVDPANGTGFHNSIAIGADGLGLVSYQDGNPDNDLRVAHCNDLACTGATITVLDIPGNQGGGTSLAIGADGLGFISYSDATAGNLKVAHCANLACTSAVLTTVDDGGTLFVGQYTSTAIGPDGLPIIAYNADGLRVAHCNNAFCSPFVARRP
jgi:hypothetical protein